MKIRGIRLFPIGSMVLSAVIAVAAGAVANAQTKPAEAAAVAPAPPAPAPAVAAPVYPKRPAELPPKMPRVTCRGDQITISADNSTLDAILAAVKGCTGAKIDIPDGASRVRSFEELGPGPVREVLDELLSGTQYNYVIQSSEANPLKVETVLLSMRTNDTDKPGSGPGSADIPMTAGRRAWQHMQKFDKPDPSSLNPDGTPIEAGATPADDVASPAAQAAEANPAQASGNDAAAAEAVAAPPVMPVAPPIVDPGSNADPSKAVEDRIAAMQQMFNQRQQMIQKQNLGHSGSPQ